MQKAILVAFLTFATSANVNAAMPPQIRLPAPVPTVPTPGPDSALALSSEMMFVVDSDVPFLIFASPRNIVSIEKIDGPLKIRGKFAGGNGQSETRSFQGKHLAIVEARGTGKVELLIIPASAKTEADSILRILDVNFDTKPQPPPNPRPDPRPDPIKAASVWIIVVEEASVPRSIQTAKFMNDSYWQTLKPANDFRHYLSDSKMATDRGYIKAAEKVGYPAVLIMDANDGTLLKSMKVTTITDLSLAVKEVTK